MRKLNDSQGNNSSSGQFLSDERFTPPNSPKDRKNKNKRLIHGLPRNQTQTTNNTTTVSYHTSKGNFIFFIERIKKNLDLFRTEIFFFFLNRSFSYFLNI